MNENAAAAKSAASVTRLPVDGHRGTDRIVRGSRVR